MAEGSVSLRGLVAEFAERGRKADHRAVLGHVTRGPSMNGSSKRTGRVHVAVDDATRLAKVEVLDGERKTTTTGYLPRALRWFRDPRIGPNG